MALNSINRQIEEAKKKDVKYLLNESEHRELIDKYLLLCRKFGVRPMLKKEMRSRNVYVRPYSQKIEENFRKELLSANTVRQCNGLFKRLDNHRNNIVLRDKESWVALLDMNFKIRGNIELVIQYLERINYPHTDFYTSNSEYAHLVIAAALDNPDYKPSMLNHICRKSGHQGFYNMIKVYAELGDMNMSKSLFQRYLAMCKLLTN